jgi:hypothetical protein
MNELFENWGEIKSGLLEGLNDTQRKILDPLLENQKTQVLAETASAGSTDTSAVAGFRKILIPMIRRIIPGTIATEIVGVQPMTGPVGLVYSLRYKYAESITTNASSGPIDHGIGDIDVSVDPEAFGNYNYIRRFYSGATDAAQAAGAGGFGAPTPGNITGTAQGAGWPSALDAASVGPFGAAGSLHGGGSSWLEGSGGRKMSVEIVSQAVEAKSRKLQASWTIEAMQDIQAQHGINIENEMTQALSATIVQEIDNEIITDLLSLAGTVASFDGSVPVGPGFYRPTFVGDRLANLGVMINYVANEIARKTRRGKANFIVVSPMIVSVLQTAAKSVFAPAVAGSFKGPNNTQLAGTLNGDIKVYSYLWNNVQATDVGGTGNDQILVGYKGGNGETDTGYFYCPYVPLTSAGVIMNPVTTQPVISLMTRYGKTTFVNKSTSLGNSADYYGKLVVNSLSLA